MEITPINTGHPPPPPRKFEASFGIVDGRVRYTLKSTYSPRLDGDISGERGGSTVADASIVDGNSVSSILPYVNPLGMQLTATSNPYTAMVGRKSVPVLVADVESAITAQENHWVEFRNHQDANRLAIESIAAPGDATPVVTGPFTFTGEMPTPPAGSTEANPIIGPTLTFGSEGMTPDPAPTGGTTSTVGYMLAGGGIMELTAVDSVIKKRLTFTSRWRVDKVEGFTLVKNGKTKDYGLVGRYTASSWGAPYPVLPDFSALTKAEIVAHFLEQIKVAFTTMTMWLPCASFPANGLASEVVYDPEGPLFAGNDPPHSGPYVVDLGGVDFIQDFGEYHTETFQSTVVRYQLVKPSIRECRAGFEVFHPSVALSFVRVGTDVYPTPEEAMAALASLVGQSWSYSYSSAQGLNTGQLTLVSVIGYTANLHWTSTQYTILGDVASVGDQSLSKPITVETIQVQVGEYLIETTPRARYVLTEEAGTFGYSELEVKPKKFGKKGI